MQYETVRQKLQNTSTSEILRARVPKGQRIGLPLPTAWESLIPPTDLSSKDQVQVEDFG